MKETTIKLSKGFREWLIDQREKRETYEDIIIRLIQSSLKKEEN